MEDKRVSDTLQLPQTNKCDFSEDSIEGITLYTMFIGSTNVSYDKLLSGSYQLHQTLNRLKCDSLYLGIVYFFFQNGAVYINALSRVLEAERGSILFRLNELEKLGIVQEVSHNSDDVILAKQFWKEFDRMKHKRMGEAHLRKMRFYNLTKGGRKAIAQIMPVLVKELDEKKRRAIDNHKHALLKTHKVVEREHNIGVAQAKEQLMRLRNDFGSGYTTDANGRKISVRYELTLKNYAKKLNMKPAILEKKISEWENG